MALWPVGVLGAVRRMSIYTSLYVITLFVNKYVLSVLNFTYPTIFQGWQSLVGAILLRVLIGMGKINVELSQVTRARVTPWLPAMMLHVLSIYSGSVALSKISVPVFVCLHNLTQVFTAAAEVIILKKLVLDLKSALLFILLSSSIFIGATDPNFDGTAYLWMAGHIISSGCIIIYQHIFRSNIQLGELEKVYLNYIYSLAVLLPCTYFLGDAMKAQNFQFWYYYKFYISCVLSGVFGVLLIVYQNSVSPCGTRLISADIASIAKVTASCLSLVVFPFTPTFLNVPWILVNLSAGLLLRQGEAEQTSDSMTKTLPSPTSQSEGPNGQAEPI